MKTDLRYEVILPNDDREELHVECEATPNRPELYTLRYPAGRDGTAIWPSETIFLTGAEFDQLSGIVQQFRKMKGLSDDNAICED